MSSAVVDLELENRNFCLAALTFAEIIVVAVSSEFSVGSLDRYMGYLNTKARRVHFCIKLI